MAGVLSTEHARTAAAQDVRHGEIRGRDLVRLQLKLKWTLWKRSYRKNIGKIIGTSIGAINASGIEALADTQVAALSQTQIKALTTTQIPKFAPTVVFDVSQLTTLSSQQVTPITGNRIGTIPKGSFCRHRRLRKRIIPRRK